MKCSYFYGDSLVRLQFWKLKSEKTGGFGDHLDYSPKLLSLFIGQSSGIIPSTQHKLQWFSWLSLYFFLYVKDHFWYKWIRKLKPKTFCLLNFTLPQCWTFYLVTASCGYSTTTITTITTTTMNSTTTTFYRQPWLLSHWWQCYLPTTWLLSKVWVLKKMFKITEACL